MSFQAYLDSIEKRTGLTARQLIAAAQSRGYDAPGVKTRVILDWLKQDYDLGRGHGMALVHVLRNGALAESRHALSGGLPDTADALWLDGSATKPTV